MTKLNVTMRNLVILLMVTFSLSSFSQSLNSKRSDIVYKQLHSRKLSKNKSLYADGVKLKMNLSTLEASRSATSSWNTSEIPADNLYKGQWRNQYVDAYDNMSAPDSFRVDLSNFSIPCKGYMTSNFGRRGRSRYHYGVDLKARTGDTIYAAFDGKVRVKDYEAGGYGNFVVMRHPNGLETVYGHLSKFLVKENQVVRSGQAIGLAGNTGRSFGSHLHFEFRFFGNPINPNFIVDFRNKVPHRDTYMVTRRSYVKTSNSSSMVLGGSDSYDDYSNYRKSSNSNNRFVKGDIEYHRVKSGENISKIARRYGISVKKICNLNNITSKTKLKAGESLRVS